jgi:hypothetical protein
MARSNDWSPLGLWSDPVPGEPSVVASGGSEYSAVAEAIGRAAFNLKGIAKTEGMISEAVDALVDQAEEVARRIERAKERYEGVGDALTTYAGPLATAQQWSLEALTSATAAASASSESDDVIARYQYELLNPLLDAESREKYQRLTDEAADARASSQGTLTAAIDLLQRAIDLRDSAADTAAESISKVESTGGLNDGFWENVDQFFEEHGDFINDILTIAGYVAGALAVVALFIPGLNVIVLAAGILLAVATTVNAVGQAMTGHMSWTEALISTALAIVPFGIGRVAGKGLLVTRNATREAAITSTMRQAAGAGESGVTRAVATQRITAYLDDAAPAVGRLRVKSDQVIADAQIRALARLRLADGSVSQIIATAAKPRLGFTAAWASAELFTAPIETAANYVSKPLHSRTTTIVPDLHPQW